ncbi:hypothetical protein [Herbaspirillum huttiense]|uniref:hypothetical protein n=1 Tax=Herbaspirillum huttiense TaxID=863372 RepID=UPI0031DAA339
MNNDENGNGLSRPTRPAPPMPGVKPPRVSTDAFRNVAASATLERLGYTWEGSAEWKPPLGQAPNFDLLDAARAEIEELRLQLASFNQVLHGEHARVDIEAIAKAAGGEFDESGGIYFPRKFWGFFSANMRELLTVAQASNTVRVDASPEFIKQSLARLSADAGQDPSPADAPLETSEDEARPYVPAMASLQAAYEATAGVRAALDKLGEAVGEGQIVDADYWAGDEEAISNALVELHDITRALTGYEFGLPLFLPNEHEKLSAVLRKMLADQRSALAQQNRAESIPYQVEVKLSASEATKMVEDAIAASGYPWTAAARDVLAERRRQQEVEGWTPERDDKYINCDLARAAATYALCTKAHELKVCDVVAWPWPIHWWKPTSYRRNLEKAGALILAEIERLDRAAEKGGAA